MRLPDPNAPLLIGDGVAVMPATPFSRIEVPSNSKAQRLVASTKRKLADLPAIPEHLNTFAVLLVYTASGLSDNEIALTLGATPAQLAKMRDHKAYKQLEQHMVEAVASQSKTEVATILANKEVKAAEKLGDLIESEDHRIALQAANSILDRRGHTAKQPVDPAQEMRATFRIEVVDKRHDAVPIIEMETDNGNRA
jgi:hypothetical protein